MDAPDLLSLGQHCSVDDCRQRDFLPFTCDCCNRVFCLEHRTYSGHSCQKAASRSTTTVICPLCARAIKIGHDQNPNAVFEEHTAQGCDPANYAKVMRKKKCPVPGCRERLTSINTYTCKHCSENVCLKHRFPEDHSCLKKQQQGRSQEPSAMASLRRFFSFDTGESLARAQQSTPAGGVPGFKQPSPARSLASSRGAAERQQPGQQAAAQGGALEFCPVCGAGFHSLNDLISHSAVHDRVSADPETCPHCQATFPDAVSLVAHVEKQHTRKSACVLS